MLFLLFEIHKNTFDFTIGLAINSTEFYAIKIFRYEK